MESLVEEEVQLDGAQVTATLRYSGVLQWHGTTKQGCLMVQDDVIGIKRGELSIIWSESIQVFLNEAGNFRSRSLSLSLCLSLFCNMMRNGRRGSQNRFEPSYL